MRILKPGETFAGCRILSFCGSGGAGSVYLASDAMQRRIALKIVHTAASERELNGVRSYIRAAAGKPGLLQIYHAGIEQDSLFYLMEAADALENTGRTYIPKTLAAVLKREGKLAPRQALTLIRNLAQGLEILHDAGLVHRDIKPENIIFVRGLPKLCDPGLVCNADTANSFAGTLGFLPPECFEGLNLNEPGRDVYALGKVFYITVSGESPARYPDLPLELPLSVQRKFWPVLTRVCAANPKHRFASVREFCQALPQELPKAGRFEQFMENCRQWILAHPYFMPAVSAVVILLAAAGLAAGGCYYRIRHQREELLRQCRQQCELAGKRFHSRLPQLADQLYATADEKTARSILSELKNPPSDPKLRLAAYRHLDTGLEGLARRQLIPIPAQASDPEIRRLSDRVRGLLASPLADWLGPAEKNRLLAKLTQLENRVFTKDFQLKPGSEFLPDSSFRSKYVYVPAGAFRTKKGRLVRIPYAFWCCDGELRADLFKNVMHQNDSGMVADLPMVRMTWNDLLEYCFILTRTYRERGMIPDGFICRPLTTREWQWACRGAWYGPGNATAFLKSNSGGKVRPIRSGEPNPLGIFDMPGNVGEITVPEPEDRQSHCIEYCGAWYENTSFDPEKHSPYLRYQFLPPYIGSRIAIVPGDMDFFEREFWITEPRQTVIGGQRYELLATNQTTTTVDKARNLCRLLGGHLLVPVSDAQVKTLAKAFFETGSFPVCIDASLKDGKWIRPDGKPFEKVTMPGKPIHKYWILTLHRRTIRIYYSNRAAGLICQWSEAEYRDRDRNRDFRNQPAVLHTFREGKKLYVLIDYSAHSHTARRIAQLLGGRLAEPRTEALKERFRKELAPWKKIPVMMGGIWKYGRWVYHDGTPADLNPELRGAVILNSMNPASPGLLDGQFCALQLGQALLAEFPLE